MEKAYLKKVREALEERSLELADLAVDKAHIGEDDPGRSLADVSEPDCGPSQCSSREWSSVEDTLPHSLVFI